MSVRAVRIAGLLAFASTMVYLVTGVGWWTPATDGYGEFRLFVLTVVHVVALTAAAVSYIE